MPSHHAHEDKNGEKQGRLSPSRGLSQKIEPHSGRQNPKEPVGLKEAILAVQDQKPNKGQDPRTNEPIEWDIRRLADANPTGGQQKQGRQKGQPNPF
jgi:hypothetical protein